LPWWMLCHFSSINIVLRSRSKFEVAIQMKDSILHPAHRLVRNRAAEDRFSGGPESHGET